MFVFTEPMAQKPFRSVYCVRKAFVSAATSMGSPSSVPVPWRFDIANGFRFDISHDHERLESPWLALRRWEP